jgi:hypothetical protein
MPPEAIHLSIALHHLLVVTLGGLTAC